MEEQLFNDLVNAFGSGGTPPVSHGLNLTLKLADPKKLPLLLWQIAAAQPRLYTALQELSFVHFARFVPTWDGSALMVITEFDGPIEPYVLDFAVAIGDEFDLLLSFVDRSVYHDLQLPIRDHPEAFRDFVMRWNRVTLGPRSSPAAEGTLLPPSFDYPLYSAYPDKTVIDIAGPHARLPSPALDGPMARIEHDDIQGNLLRGYRASAALHLFLQIREAPKARKWIASQFPMVRPGDSVARPMGIETARPWLADNAAPTEMPNVAFTFEGLKQLLPGRTEDLELLPKAFRDGALERAHQNYDRGASRPSVWLFGGQGKPVHVVLSIYTRDEALRPRQEPEPLLGDADELVAMARSGDIPAALSPTMRRLVTLLRDLLDAIPTFGGMSVVHLQICRDEGGQEAFGNRDGIARPRISGQSKPAEPDCQPSVSPGEFLLGENFRNVYGGTSVGDMPLDLVRNGSFAALRLLEQDVTAYNAFCAAHATKGTDAEAVGAQLLGRRRDGCPLWMPAETGPTNAFDYAPSSAYPANKDDHFGERCPVGAHIRRVNPRSARVAGARHSRRLLRRGMPTSWREPGNDGASLQKRGLLGLFHCTDLERQFEFVQREWIHGDLAASGIRGTQDPLVGLRDTTTPFKLVIDGKPQTVDVPPLVRTRGSLYLFFPGLAAIRNLATLNQGSTASMPEASPVDWERIIAGLPGLPSLPGHDLITGLVRGAFDVPQVRKWLMRLLPKPPDEVKPPKEMPVAAFDPCDPRFIASPWQALAEARSNGPIVWVPAHKACWVVSRELAIKVLKNPETFVQKVGATETRGVFSADGRQHERLRLVVTQAFNNLLPNVEAHLPAAIKHALDGIDGLEQVDAVTAYTNVVPRDVVFSMLGVPSAYVPEFDRLAKSAALHFGQPTGNGRSHSAALADALVRLAGRWTVLLLLAKLERAVQWPAETLADGLTHGAQAVKTVVQKTLGATFGAAFGATAAVLSDAEKVIQRQWDEASHLTGLDRLSFRDTLVWEIAGSVNLTAGDPQALSVVEAIATLVQITLGGQAAQFLLGSAVWHLLRPSSGSPLAWTQLNKDPALLEDAIDEARRCEPPVTILDRYVNVDGALLGDYSLPLGFPVSVVLASANRDITSANPEDFVWNRHVPRNEAHVSLGAGFHECAGAALQRAIVAPALRALIEMYPDMRLRDPDAVPPWSDNVRFRSLLGLPVLPGPKFCQGHKDDS